MTWGLLAGLGSGLAVAVLLLGMAALQIEKARAPAPPKMLHPAVEQELHVAASPAPSHALMAVPGRLAGPQDAGAVPRILPPVLALPDASGPLPRPAPPPDPDAVARARAPLPVELLGAEAAGLPGPAMDEGPEVALAPAPPRLLPPGAPELRAEGALPLPAGLPFPGPVLPPGLHELAPAAAVLVPALPEAPGPAAPMPAAGPAALSAPLAPGGAAMPAAPAPLSGLPQLPSRPVPPELPPAADSVGTLAPDLTPFLPAVGDPAAARLVPPVSAALPDAGEPAGLPGAPGPGDLLRGGLLEMASAAAAADGPSLAIVLMDPAPGDLPSWARSVALPPDRLEQAPAGREVLAKLAEPADRGALAAMAWRVSALPHPGPLLVAAAPEGERALGAMRSFLEASGLGAVVDGADLPGLGPDTARAYPPAPLELRLARAAAHARRDGAVILPLADSPEARAAVAAFLDGEGNDLVPVTAGDALKLLAPR
ncbi:hypothetical protein [Mangrovicoccus sp. HB161399]|uniref:hypothetical protein n=1 Tax=Mangrovicoccus sp. HB161399 TaxID=2720392 RepID=UPI0015523A9D|nr:hypothetical protein [Mangrovicoccus sp. HB161399]